MGGATSHGIPRAKAKPSSRPVGRIGQQRKGGQQVVHLLSCDAGRQGEAILFHGSRGHDPELEQDLRGDAKLLPRFDELVEILSAASVQRIGRIDDRHNDVRVKKDAHGASSYEFLRRMKGVRRPSPMIVSATCTSSCPSAGEPPPGPGNGLGTRPSPTGFVQSAKRSRRAHAPPTNDTGVTSRALIDRRRPGGYSADPCREANG